MIAKHIPAKNATLAALLAEGFTSITQSVTFNSCSRSKSTFLATLSTYMLIFSVSLEVINITYQLKPVCQNDWTALSYHVCTVRNHYSDKSDSVARTCPTYFFVLYISASIFFCCSNRHPVFCVSLEISSKNRVYLIHYARRPLSLTNPGLWLILSAFVCCEFLVHSISIEQAKYCI